MFAITVIVGPAAWSLLFKEKEHWEAATSILKLASGNLTLIDDFGQEFCASCSSINGYMIEDMNQSKLAHVERGLHGQHIQAELQKRVEHDPTLRMRSPPVLTPGGLLPPGPAFNGGR